MPGLFGILELGRNSLLAQQAALQAAGHNIANAATPGYHRQRVEMRPTLPELYTFGALGTGVRIDTVRRIESRFLELSLQREIPLHARFSARAGILSEAELAFGEPSEGGVQSFLDQFYTAWNELAATPEDLGARESVVRSALSLTQSIRSAHLRITEQSESLTGEMHRVVDDANRVLGELEALNRTIRSQSARTSSLGDLADRRDLLIETLADLLGAQGAIEEDGTATVRLGGRVVLQGEISQPLTWESGADPNARFPRMSSRGVWGGSSKLAMKIWPASCAVSMNSPLAWRRRSTPFTAKASIPSAMPRRISSSSPAWEKMD
jgi:flagellar hook-associated protein 1 FlgK